MQKLCESRSLLKSGLYVFTPKKSFPLGSNHRLVSCSNHKYYRCGGRRRSRRRWVWQWRQRRQRCWNDAIWEYAFRPFDSSKKWKTCVAIRSRRRFWTWVIRSFWSRLRAWTQRTFTWITRTSSSPRRHRFSSSMAGLRLWFRTSKRSSWRTSSTRSFRTTIPPFPIRSRTRSPCDSA